MTSPNTGPDFSGTEYDRELDCARLTGQLLAVHEAMADHEWRTIPEIQAITGIRLDGSVSKQLRHLRYERFGAYEVEKRRVTETGLWEYRVGEKGSGRPRHRICPHCGGVVTGDVYESDPTPTLRNFDS